MSDISELFSRDPLDLTDEDIDRIIAHYRESRHLFNTGLTTGGKKTSSNLTESQKEAKNLGLKIEL